MNKNNKSSLALKNSICVLLSFIESLLIMVITVGLCFLVILSPLFIKGALKSSDYVNLTVEEMKTELNDLAIPAGLPADFFNDKFTEKDKEELLELGITRISSDIKQSSYTVDMEPIKDKFRGYIEEYATEKLGSSDAISSDAIDMLLTECATIYKVHARPASVRRLFTGLGQVLTPLMIVSLVSVALVVGIFLFQRRLLKREEFWRYGFSVVFGSALMTGVFPLYLLITGTIEKIGMASKSMREFFITYLESFLVVFVVASVILTALSVLCLLTLKGKLCFKKPLKTLDKTE